MKVWVKCMYCKLEYRRCGISNHIKNMHKEVAKARTDSSNGFIKPIQGVDWAIIGKPSADSMQDRKLSKLNRQEQSQEIEQVNEES